VRERDPLPAGERKEEVAGGSLREARGEVGEAPPVAAQDCVLLAGEGA
jgi:hypothetical protein